MINILGYRVTETIHESSGINLHLGYRVRDGRPVIVKTPGIQPPSMRIIKNFKREFDILTGLDSPLVIKILELIVMDEKASVIYEGFPGQPLGALIQKEKIEIDRFLVLAAEMAEALADLHQSNVAHLALNPDNLLIDPEDGLKLINFDAAIRIDLEASFDFRRYPVYGDPAYTAPELTGRINLAVDHRTDLYALGAIMYQMALGRPPFNEKDPWDLAWSHLARPPLPPHEVNPEFPPQVSSIILKLLAKNPEDRYQTAFGLKQDLEKSLDLYRKTGLIPVFPLKRNMAAGILPFSGKLYGREKEQTVLEEFLKDVRSGAGRFVLVAGRAGIGKTALVNEIQKTVVENGGFFISGKYEQNQYNTPYTGLLTALKQLVGQLYGRRESELNMWLDLLREALGPNAGVMTGFLPELEQLLGPQATPAATGPLESRQRFHLAFTDFIRPFCRAGRPLVIFLDDLQWVDQATLNLLEALFSHPESGNLMIVGAYRDNEVQADHILTRARQRIKDQGRPVESLNLDPLGLGDINRFINETLIENPGVASDLAQYVFTKTGGNPFFMTRLLHSLQTEGVLRINNKENIWEWSPRKAGKLKVSDDLLDFLASQISGLPRETQRILALAACMGSSFNLDEPGFIAGHSLTSTYNLLFPAVQAGLILPRSGLEPVDPENLNSPRVVIRYRFLHDRIKQTAYGFLNDAERQKVHLTMGRNLFDKLNDRDRKERIFEISDHLNAGRNLISDIKEKNNLARINLEAGRKAMDALAFNSAAGYLEIARHALPENPWQKDYELALSIYKDAASVECLDGNYRKARELIAVCLAQARSDRDKLEVFGLAIFVKSVEGRYEEIIPLGKAALNLLGIELPDKITPALLETEQTRIMNLIADRPIASLINLPVNSDPKWNLAMKIINGLGKIIFLIDPMITRWLALLTIGITLKYRHMEEAVSVFAVYGLNHIMAGNIDLGYELGLLGIESAKKFGNQVQKCYAHVIFASLIIIWKRHLRESHLYYKIGFQSGISAGEYQYAVSCLWYEAVTAFHQGKNLSEVKGEFKRFIRYADVTKLKIFVNMGRCLKIILDNFLGITREKLDFDTDDILEKDLLNQMHAQNEKFQLFYYLVLKAQALSFYNQPALALETLNKAESYKQFCASEFSLPEYCFYYSLTLAVLSGEAEPAKKRKFTKKLNEYRGMLKFWAGHCPQNFLGRHYLVEAETARINGRALDAADLYEKAVLSAVENEFTQVAALANELAGRFWLSRGHDRIARMYLLEAYNGWRRWGADRKALLFEEEFLDYLEPAPMIDRTVASAARTDPSSGRAEAEYLEKTAVIQAVQSVAGESDRVRLLEQLTKIAVRSSGAQKGFLILKENEQLIIKCRDDIDKPGTASCVSLPVDEHSDLCVPILYFTLRTRQPLLLENAAASGDFVHDIHIGKCQVKSVLCLPLISQGNLAGLFYLENRLLPGVFTPDRLEILNFLAPWTVLALALARLDDDLMEKERDLDQARTALKTLGEEKSVDKQEMKKNILDIVNRIVFPHINKLKNAGPTPEQMTCLKDLEYDLKKSTGDSAFHLSFLAYGLTPMEIQVAEMIEDGLTSDQMADRLHISSGTVAFHRANLRHKLGLTGKRINLRVHLLSLMKE